MRRYIQFFFRSSLLLVGGTLIALVWANWNYRGYQSAAHSIHFFVNEIGMAFFFALAAKEIFESMLPGGFLFPLKHAAMPVLASLGGMVGPAALYLWGAHLLSRPDLTRGWAIPCATDVAFSYLVATVLFGPKHPAVIFLLLLAIVDDALGLAILVLFYPSGEVDLLYFLLGAGGGTGLALLLKARRVHSFWLYLLGPGVLSWVGFWKGGLHPALALVPIVFCMPHEPRDLGIFAAEEERLPNTLNEFEHWWKHPVEGILGLFGFANAGVAFSQVGTATGLVVGGLIIGKPVGILAFSVSGKLLGLSLPQGVSWKELTVVGFAAAIGFTVSLFISTLAFPTSENLEHAKMGALASLVAAPLTVAAGKLLGLRPK